MGIPKTPIRSQEFEDAVEGNSAASRLVWYGQARDVWWSAGKEDRVETWCVMMRRFIELPVIQQERLVSEEVEVVGEGT